MLRFEHISAAIRPRWFRFVTRGAHWVGADVPRSECNAPSSAPVLARAFGPIGFLTAGAEPKGDARVGGSDAAGKRGLGGGLGGFCEVEVPNCIAPGCEPVEFFSLGAWDCEPVVGKLQAPFADG